jgi:hypothetical protein
MAVTSGEIAVTSGKARLLPLSVPESWRPMLLIAAIGFIVALVNVTSELLEAGRDGEVLHPRGPLLWEFSSYALLVALAPLIGEAVRRWPPRADNLLRTAAIHGALTIPFSIVHVTGMVGLRKLGYWAWGGFYDFSHGALLREFLYEWRKDVLSYFLLGTVFWFFQWQAQKATAAPASSETAGRIEIREGARAVFLAPADIAWLEAAGNYVEVHAAGRTHLVRATLASFEAQLAPLGFVRAHRSRLVNKARIRAIAPSGSGDVEIIFDDGRSVAGSRRYRAGLEGVG